jgi:hypothetical protein
MCLARADRVVSVLQARLFQPAELSVMKVSERQRSVILTIEQNQFPFGWCPGYRGVTDSLNPDVTTLQNLVPPGRPDPQ